MYNIQVNIQCWQHVFVGQCAFALLHVELVNTENGAAVGFLFYCYDVICKHQGHCTHDLFLSSGRSRDSREPTTNRETKTAAVSVCSAVHLDHTELIMNI
jgi:hypothetical protein